LPAPHLDVGSGLTHIKDQPAGGLQISPSALAASKLSRCSLRHDTISLSGGGRVREVRRRGIVAEGLITPDQLRRIGEEKEMAQVREALEKKRKADEERDHLRDAFMAQEIHPDVFERVSKVVRSAAEHGEREVLALRFPSDYCTDGGRAINNAEPGWPDTLTGFAKRAHEFWQKELQPHGYKVRAQIMDFPGGVPGDVGLFLRW
jgi:hypothetical protein